MTGIFGSVVGGVADAAGKVEEQAEENLAPTADELLSLGKDAAREAEKELEHHTVHVEDRNRLEGHSKLYNNCVVASLVGSVIFAAALGAVADALFLRKWYQVEGRPRGWVIGVLVASYAMLIPGIASTLFSVNIFLDIKLSAMGDIGYNITRRPITESMWSVIGLLFKTGGTVGALLVILYAMVVPLLKILLLAVGEFWRGSEQPRLRRASSACIFLVQLTSKWASPDMFAYILLLVLCRHLDHPPLIQSAASLDVGFSCFCLFCLCSTFSTLSIERPNAEPRGLQLANSDEDGVASLALEVAKIPQLVFLQRGLKKRLLPVVSVLTAAFFALFFCGLLTPCMSVHIDTSVLVEPKGPVPRNLDWMLDEALDSLDLTPLMHADVSLLECMSRLMGWISKGEITSLVAFLMLAVFTVSITVVDMLLLWAATFVSAQPGPNKALAASHVLKHISMLDVFCMGVVVVCMAGHAYRDQGVNLDLARGMLPLIGAECVHYAVFHIVSNAVPAADFEKVEEGCSEFIE
jgi:hypothetical protein